MPLYPRRVNLRELINPNGPKTYRQWSKEDHNTLLKLLNVQDKNGKFIPKGAIAMVMDRTVPSINGYIKTRLEGGPIYRRSMNETEALKHIQSVLKVK